MGIAYKLANDLCGLTDEEKTSLLTPSNIKSPIQSNLGQNYQCINEYIKTSKNSAIQSVFPQLDLKNDNFLDSLKWWRKLNAGNLFFNALFAVTGLVIVLSV